jgi:hypothetical protein
MDFTNPLVYGVPCFLGFIAIELTTAKLLMTNNYINGKI